MKQTGKFILSARYVFCKMINLKTGSRRYTHVGLTRVKSAASYKETPGITWWLCVVTRCNTALYSRASQSPPINSRRLKYYPVYFYGRHKSGRNFFIKPTAGFFVPPKPSGGKDAKPTYFYRWDALLRISYYSLVGMSAARTREQQINFLRRPGRPPSTASEKNTCLEREPVS